MKIQRGWGRNFMAKFSCEGAEKDTEATRGSSQRARQENANSSNLSEKLDKNDQEEWDKETTEGYLVNQQEPGAELDITMIVQSMKLGKRSARQRRKSSVPWAQLLGFNFRNVEREPRNDLGVSTNKMKRTRRGTKPKGNKSVGGGSDATNQSTPTNFDKAQGSAADKDAGEHLGVPKSDTSSKSKEQCGIDADEYASKKSGVPVLADDTPLMSNIWSDFKKSKDAVADGLMAKTDLTSHYEAKGNHIKFDPTIIPGLDLEDGAEKFDTSTTESALASLSLSTASAPDPCIEFAVNILKDEAPLTAYVPEVDEVIKKMMCLHNSTSAGTSKSAQGRKD